MKPQFLVHNGDSVVVAVVEIKRGEKLTGSYLEYGASTLVIQKTIYRKVAVKDFVRQVDFCRSTKT